MKEWWHNLSQREQYLSIMGTIITLLLVFYFYLWSPFLEALNNLQQQINYQQSLVSLMQDAIQSQHQQHSAKRQNVAATKLLSLITENLKSSSLGNYPHHLAQTQDNTIRLEFASVPFDQFMTWLTEFWRAYIFDISHLEVTPLAESGIVKLTIILKI